MVMLDGIRWGSEDSHAMLDRIKWGSEESHADVR